jgi:site-specific recombinase XerD
MATIHKRRRRSGEVVWELTHGTGSDRQRFIAGRSREEAQQVLNQFKHQLALHGAAFTDDSVASVLGQYVAYLETNRREATRRRYVRVLQTFQRRFLEPYFPAVQRLRQVTPAHVEEYKTRRVQGTLRDFVDEEGDRQDLKLRHQVAQGSSAATPKDNAKFGWLGRKRFHPVVAPRTVNYELQVLRTFFRWAMAHNFILVNPTARVERLRISKRAIPKFLTTDQLKRLFTACSASERRLFVTILMTGMRRGEVEHLTWSDVNFELGVIFIQEKPEWDWKPKTDERLIPISPALRAVLVQQHALRRNDGLVFPNKEGNLDTHILPKLKKVGRKAGLPTVTVHALRHSFGAHLRMAGVSLADIADLLGHKDLATTQIYAKVHQEHLRGVIAKLTPVVLDATESPLTQITAEPEDASPTLVRRLKN